MTQPDTSTSKETAAQKRDRRLLEAANNYLEAITMLKAAIHDGLHVGLQGMRLDIPKSVYLYRVDGHGRIHTVLEKSL